MRRLRAFFARLGRIRVPRWVALAAGLALVAILIWFVGPLITIAKWTPLGSWMVRLATIVLLCGGVGGWFAWRTIQRRKLNEQMVGELAEAPNPEDAGDYSADDIRQMNERADAALALMKSVRVGKDREYIYELPWYLIIGPPGAGKTTALHNSSLNFPVAQELGAEPVLGIGGTRTCEWWFTDQAVLIDTAGRYTTQDSHAPTDGKAWLGFLDMLGKYRPRQPITGLIVAMSVADLLNGDERDVAAHGRAVRSRINEVTQKLGVRAPVYVLITKMDLVAGFSDFFDDAGQPDRDQVWGHTFGIDASRSGATLGADLALAFAGLTERLSDRLLGRIQDERDIARRGSIFGFPQQFASLEKPLSSFMQIVGRETKFEPTPMIRGFYFTSGAQFGRPIDRLMAAIAAKFGVSAAPVAGSGETGRSYFLRTLLHDVIFGEAALADRDPKSEIRRRRLRVGAIAAGVAALGLASGLWVASYVRNITLLHKLETQAVELQKSVAQLPSGDVSDSDLDQILPVLDQARTLPFASTAPANLRAPGWTFGMSRRQAVRTQVDAAYINLLNQQMLPRLVLGLEDRLRSALQEGQRTGGQDSRPEVYSLLRVYLMLGRAPGAPLEQAQIANWYAGEWASRYSGGEDDGTRASLERHLNSLLASRLTPPPLDRELIVAARDRVRSLGPGERAYARLLSDPALADLPAFTLADIPSVGNSGLFARRSGKSLALGVPGLYRRQGFYSTVLPAVAKAATQSVNEVWVTDDKAAKGVVPVANEVGRIKDEILIAYLNDFTRQWDDFIGDITISGEHSPGQRIQIATRPPSPVKQLFASLAAETNLTPPSLSRKAGGGASNAVRIGAMFSRRLYRGLSNLNSIGFGMSSGARAAEPPGPLDEVIEHFRWLQDLNPAQGPAPLDGALQALLGVGESSLAAQAASGLGDPLLQRTKTSSAMEATARLDQTASTLPPVVRDMFSGFIKSSATQLNRSVKQNIQQQYAAELLPQCRSIVGQGYPFSNSAQQTTVDDLSRLFRPMGLFDQFSQANLAGMIDMSGSVWKASSAGGALGLQQASIRELQRADRIRKRFFLPGDVRPNVRFLLEPVQVASASGSVALSVDGVPAAFERGVRRPVELRWPGPSPGVSLSFPRAGGAGATRTWSGDFALMRMIESGRVTASSTKSLTVQVGIEGEQATFTLRFLNGDNPFVLGDLKSFKCPTNL